MTSFSLLATGAALTLALAATPHPSAAQSASAEEPLRLAIAGLVHGHVSGFLNALQRRTDVELVGIYEPDEAIAAKYADRYDLDASLFYTDLEALLTETTPEAVAAFTNTFDHRDVVVQSAAHSVPVMMEKPLAVSMEHARTMAEAARESGIDVIVNYETTWYPSNHAAFRMTRADEGTGPLRKIVVHDGHEGPKEIGVQPEFLDWLTDPVLNGGGALTDFGCYGANLITWLMENARPTSVTAVTQQIKNDPAYARVDDETTILLTYPDAQGIIQASWNWPFSRKDMEVYGTDGYVHTVAGDGLRIRTEAGQAETRAEAPPLDAPYGDPLTYLTAVVRGQIEPEGLSSLENNLIVTEILDAARRSAETGLTVRLSTGAE